MHFHLLLVVNFATPNFYELARKDWFLNMANLQEFILFCIDFPLFIFHLTTLVVLVSKLYQKQPDFQGGFYHVFVVLAIAGSFSYVHVSVGYGVGEF